jgi:hypothetical protein
MMSSISSWWSRFSKDFEGVAPSTPDNIETYKVQNDTATVYARVSQKNNSAPSPSPYAPLVGILLECGTIIGTCFLATRTLKYLLYPSREDEGTNEIAGRNARSAALARTRQAFMVPIKLCAMTTLVVVRLCIRGPTYSLFFVKNFFHVALK